MLAACLFSIAAPTRLTRLDSTQLLPTQLVWTALDSTTRLSLTPRVLIIIIFRATKTTVPFGVALATGASSTNTRSKIHQHLPRLSHNNP